MTWFGGDGNGHTSVYVQKFYSNSDGTIATAPNTIALYINENVGVDQTVYIPDVKDGTTVTYSLDNTTGDYDNFTIDSNSGKVTLKDNPDYETKSSYNFTVVATDGGGNATEQNVHLNINDVDEIPPQLISTFPKDNAKDVPANANIVLTFDEAVQAGSGNIIITNDSDSSDTRTIDITDSSQIAISDKTVTINPTDNLTDGANYHITIASGVITDIAGNAYAGISDPAAFNFTTGAAP